MIEVIFMQKFIKKFRYPFLGSVIIVAITSVYLNLTLMRVTPAISTKLLLMNPNALLISKIQGNLDRMYIKSNNNPYFIDEIPLFASDTERQTFVTESKQKVMDVIDDPFDQEGMASTLYWNVFFRRAAWLDGYCGNRFANCGPHKFCSCLLDQGIREQLKLDHYHMFTAQDLYTYKTLYIAGCTGAARVFMNVATKFPLNTNIRHVTTVKKEDYKNGCPQQGTLWNQHTKKMDGHQVVAIQMPNGKWRILNTSSRRLSWAQYAGSTSIVEGMLSELVSNTDRRVDITFPGMPPGPDPTIHTVTSIGNDDVYGNTTLMNKYASGNVNDAHCQWPWQ